MPALLELHVHVIGYIDMIVFVDPADTINNFKANIQAKHDIPIERQRIFKGEQLLEGERTFTDYNIVDCSTIRLVNTAQ